MKKTPFQLVAKIWLALMAIIAMGAPFIAGDRPFGYDHPSGFTDFRKQALSDPATNFYFRIIPYAPGQPDESMSALKSPFHQFKIYLNSSQLINLPIRFHHWMGTDAIGADVAAGMVYGIRHSFMIAIGAMLLTTLVALFMGIISGYYAGVGMSFNSAKLISCILMIAGVCFIGKHALAEQLFLIYPALDSFKGSSVLAALIFFVILFSGYKILSRGLQLIPRLYSKNIVVDVDYWISVLTQIVVSVPNIILIIALSVIFKPSIMMLIVVFGILQWTDLSRMIRQEVIRMRTGGFVDASIVGGLSHRQIIFRHIIPNLKSVIIPVFIYGMAIVILTESGLSFLGFGVNPGTVTLGNLLSQAKENMLAWWLLLFPGLTIFLTLISLMAWSKNFK
jgi:peptide/nickel transport system permease protein